MATISFKGVVRDVRFVREYTVLKVEEFYSSEQAVKSFIYKVLIRDSVDVPLASLVTVTGDVVFRPDLKDLVIDHAQVVEGGAPKPQVAPKGIRPALRGRSDFAGGNQTAPAQKPFVDEQRSNRPNVPAGSGHEKFVDAPRTQHTHARTVATNRQGSAVDAARQAQRFVDAPRAQATQQEKVVDRVVSTPQQSTHQIQNSPKPAQRVFEAAKEIDLMGPSSTSPVRGVVVEEPPQVSGPSNEEVSGYDEHSAQDGNYSDYEEYSQAATKNERQTVPVSQSAPSLLDAGDW